MLGHVKGGFPALSQHEIVVVIFISSLASVQNGYNIHCTYGRHSVWNR